MSVAEFVQDALEEKREEIEKIKRLQQILDNLSRPETRLQIYAISVTSNT